MHNHLRNIKNERLFTASNLLRILGILTRNPLVGPLKVNIDITDKCDMHCIMCWYHSSYLEKENTADKNFFMPVELMQSLAKELKSIKTKIVMLCGRGEPMLHPHIEEMVEIMCANSLGVEIMTNAYYLDKKRIDYFSKVGLKKIIVSLHAPDFETFAKIRPLKTKEDFKIIMDNLSYLSFVRSCKKFPQFFIINVVSRLNYHAVAKMIKLAENLNVDKIIFKPLMFSAGLPEELKLPNNAINIFIEELQKISFKTIIPNNIHDYAILLKKMRCGKNSAIMCHIPFSQSVIGLDGNIVGCVYAKEHNLGNIKQSSFVDIWFGQKYKEFRKNYYCPQQCLGRAVYPLLI
jgi:MoaA/NifB/PqqE/SkfB family radical SAM enzyme